MRFKSSLALAAVFSLLIPYSTSAAGPKPGTRCNKVGLTQISKGMKYTCIKSGKSNVWNKGVVVPSPKSTSPSTTNTSESSETNVIKAGDQCTSGDRGITKTTSAGSFTCKYDGIGAYRWFAAETPTTPTPTPSATPSATIENIDWSKTESTDNGYKNLFKSWCDTETQIPKQWSEIQKAYVELSRCSGIYHLDKYNLGSQRPTTVQLFNNISIDSCKISDPENARNNRGFSNNFEPGRKSYIQARKHPGPKTKIQVVPIYALDTAPPTNTPEEDYGRYLNFVTDWAEYSSDVPSQISVNFPKKYLKFEGNVSSYKIFHENHHSVEGHQRFNRDLIAQVDSQIDFTGVDLVYVVVPAGTPLANFEQGVLGEMRTAEGVVQTGITQYPYTYEKLNTVKFNNFIVPYWWIHETYHGTFGLDDHYGSSGSTESSRGLGGWSLMSGWGGDMTAWEKWVLGFLSDQQVNCAQKDSTSINWLAPSSVKSTEKKMTVIPISKYKAVVIESIRAAGLYYKIPASSHGVLVYELNLELVEHGQGMTLVIPTNREPNRGPFSFGEATLRTGESVVTNGQRITVLESGNFGDVVKVEKA